ncbi:Aste57867_24126 [Aphanomyces stellatus]|uniref:Aste57867_24126 protein n=1 Tax=Aphanomyces stellatus TaxID=120398 RepID=A0A485LR68_9STRA|nr:hypothetical protein As57867_024052 [Aphanomyces stellatus]VFU00768.1 Aste57867_24126 [Aphanomyces stellatus]
MATIGIDAVPQPRLTLPKIFKAADKPVKPPRPPHHHRVIHPKSEWKKELLLPPAPPIIQLEVMRKNQVVRLLVVYYTLAFGFLFIVALDTSAATYESAPFSCTGRECDDFFYEIYISPFSASMALTVESSVPIPPDAAMLAATTFSVQDDFSQFIELDGWTSMSPTNVVSAKYSVDYGLLFGIAVDMYSILVVRVEVDGMSFGAIDDTTTLTFKWAQKFKAPYMSVYCSSIITLLDLVCMGYFVHRTRQYRTATKTQHHLPQWRWIQIILVSLLLQVQLPFTVGQFLSTAQGQVLSDDFLHASFWLYVIGQNVSRVIVLCFADGMGAVESPGVRFYAPKLCFVGALVVIQGINYECSFPKQINKNLIVAITSFEFYVQAVMVLYCWWRQGRRIRSFPYKGAKFQYVTYGVMSFLVVPEAFEATVSLLQRVGGGKPSAKGQTLIWLSSVVRVQAFAWMVLKCYLPLKPAQLAALSTIPNALPYLLHHDDTMPHKFSLHTALVMLNATATSYFHATDDHKSPSSCGRLGHDILHPHEHGYTLLESFHDAATDTNALLLYEEAKHRYILSFRGTGSFKNGLTDLKSRQVHFPCARDFRAESVDLKHRYLRSAVYVHLGFLKAYQALQARVGAAVAKLPRVPGRNLQLVCTGHSLGGALATLCALDLALTQDHITVSMYNFGSPRVGNHAFRLLFNSKVVAYRVVNDGDVITQMPKRDYTGVSSEGVGIYKHVGTEVTLLAPGSTSGESSMRGILVGPTVVDRVFVLTVRTKLTSHGMESYRQSFRSLIHHEPEFENVRPTLVEVIKEAVDDVVKAATGQQGNDDDDNMDAIDDDLLGASSSDDDDEDGTDMVEVLVQATTDMGLPMAFASER